MLNFYVFSVTRAEGPKQGAETEAAGRSALANTNQTACVTIITILINEGIG